MEAAEVGPATAVVVPKLNRCSRCLRITVFVSVTAIVVMTVATSTIHVLHFTEPFAFLTAPFNVTADGNTCPTEACLELATILLHSVNENRDPCHDFDDFICSRATGSLMKDYEEITIAMAAEAITRVRPAGQTPVEKIARLFRQCVENRGSDRHLLQKFFLDNHLTLTPKLDAIHIMLKVAVKYGYGILFDLRVKPLGNDTTLLSFEPQRDLMAWAHAAKRVKSKISYMKYMMRHLGLFQYHHNGEKDADIATTETIVHRLLFADVHASQYPSDHWTLEQIDAGFKYLRSDQLVKLIQQEAHFPTTSKYVVSFDSVRVLSFLNDVLRRVKNEHLGQYLTWEASRHLGPLADDLFGAPSVYRAHYNSLTAREPVACFRIVQSLTGNLAYAPLVSERLNETAVAMLEDMFHRILQWYVNDVENATWLTTERRKSVFAKLSHVRLSLGYLDYDPLLIDKNKIYNDLPDFKGAFLENYLSLSAWHMRNGWATEDKATFVNHTGTDNNLTLYLPSVWALPPFFSIDGSLAANYALIGQLMSTQLSRIFDAALDGSYSNQTLCLKRFYHERGGSVHANFSRTVLDVLKIKPLYEAFSEAYAVNNESITSQPVLAKYSTAQTFFQVMCLMFCPFGTKSHLMPRSLGCNVPVMNVREFSEAYHCPKNSPMNPEKRCSLWSG